MNEPLLPPGEAADIAAARERLRSGRNTPCSCGSGRKYKKCCLPLDEKRVREARQMRRGAGNRSVPPDADEAWGEVGAELPPRLSARRVRARRVGGEATADARRRDALWEELEALRRPTAEQIDTLIDALAELPAGLAGWPDVINRLADHDGVDLARAFRRICEAVRPTPEAEMAFFYSAAARLFVAHGQPERLPEVAARWRTLDVDTYDPDILEHLVDHLLVEGFEAEVLELAEHALPIMRADDRLMPYAVPGIGVLIFDLRVGRCLRAGPEACAESATLARDLRRDVEDHVAPEVAEHVAALVAGRSPRVTWTRDDFDFPATVDDNADDPQAPFPAVVLRLHTLLLHLADEAWRFAGRPPGCTLRAVMQWWDALFDHLTEQARGRRGGRSRAPSTNLLDYLGPGGLEARLAAACQDVIGTRVARARLMLEAHAVLVDAALRHGLITKGTAASTRREVARLRRALQ